ncbi:chitinase [Apiospora marii]|uniref:chitinase n=1 Tax=Apiospora marii TaxID=335849 RepID=A0ABR1RIC8_9PEZI
MHPHWLSSWLLVALGASGFFASPASAIRLSTSPAYKSRGVCPQRCSESGPSVDEWPVYPDMKQLKRCSESIFYSFGLNDPVDNGVDGAHRIAACTSSDASNANNAEDASTAIEVISARAANSSSSSDVRFEIGWWQEQSGGVGADHQSLIKQLRGYLNGGHGYSEDQPFTLFARSGQATLGVYVGRALESQELSTVALKPLEEKLSSLDVSTPELAMQLCAPGSSGAHVFGLMLSTNGTFGALQQAMTGWSHARCLAMPHSTGDVRGQVHFTMPLPSVILANNKNKTSPTLLRRAAGTSSPELRPRADCRTIQVEDQDICDTLASRCGISRKDFDKYNVGDDKFCNGLKAKQHVCCSAGSMPDFAPPPNADGSCFAHKIVEGDTCDSLSAEYSLSHELLDEYNKKTWGWNTCKNFLFKETVMCLSKGRPPFPNSLPNAVCGPQKPNSVDPKDDSDISKMNPCPLNACCNIWGQCGISKDFCVDTGTGAPGTAEPGTYGCISNCGMDIVKGDGGGAIRVGYFEGYSMNRECLYQDASQIDRSAYTHVHFGFGTLTPDFEVETGDILSTYQFEQFKKIGGSVKRILSFGGWDFSALPATYMIFRNAVTDANRLKVATNIANFIKKHDLDGVDIDWEYPGAPDIPDIPAGDKEDGARYLKFLVILKNLLPGKSVSIAAPSSYWYLKQFPIKDIGAVVDYIIYMTYDLHGQWDTDNKNSQDGCDNGNCLRSQVNLTETKLSLAMITKAGVPGRKVIVGVTSYGRTYKMASAGCWGPQCTYLGDRINSPAKKGVCTGTGGYIADAEIGEIVGDKRRAGRVVTSFVDASSNSDILVYDNDEWVSYMSPATKKTRAALYKAWGMGGTTDWATDLQKYHDVPAPASSWASFKQKALNGEEPKDDDERSGNWTSLECTNDMVSNEKKYDVATLWSGLGGDDAWADVKRVWTETDRPRYESGDDTTLSFMVSVHETLKIQGGKDGCTSILDTQCPSDSCSKGMDGPLSGPAAQLIWNSLVLIRDMHKSYYTALTGGASTFGTQVQDMENNFAPVPPPPDNKELFVLLDLLTMGTLTAAGPFFNNFIAKLPRFAAKPGSTVVPNAKDTTMTMIGQSIGLAKDLKSAPKDGDWTPGAQAKFAAYMGQVIEGWEAITVKSLEKMLDGSDESLEVLDKLLAHGAMYPKGANPRSDLDLFQNIRKAFFAYAVPILWFRAGYYPFVIDSGAACGTSNPITKYMTEEAQRQTGVCYDNRIYFLAMVEGDPRDCTEIGCEDRTFAAPTGLAGLDGQDYGGLTRDDIVAGAVRTYVENDLKNGAQPGSVDLDSDDSKDALYGLDVTTPGFIALPVCSPVVARRSWEATKGPVGAPDKGSTPNWPCDAVKGLSKCGEYEFDEGGTVDEDSPSVRDCEQIIRNIQGDTTTDWTQEVVGKKWRHIQADGCRFSFRASKVGDNIVFYVGGQNVIDLIEQSVRDYAKDGRVSASGHMTCGASARKQWTEWKLQKS